MSTSCLDAMCRSCGSVLSDVVLDLGMSPLCQTVKPPSAVDTYEVFYPLRVYLCHDCWLLQLREYASPHEIFQDDYPYFSSFSDSWLEHARQYTNAMIDRFSLDGSSQVVEIASNDGYLLRNFVQRRIPALGIEPAKNVANAARAAGVPTISRFFGRELARELADEGKQANLLLGNNVLAHVPNLNDFVAGLAILLQPHGVLTMEFPHLMELMRGNQFDTIYHEHFSYLSLGSVEQVFARHGLMVFDVDRLPTHGGSLRIYAQLEHGGRFQTDERGGRLRTAEQEAGLRDVASYHVFADQVAATKRQIVRFLLDAQAEGKRVAGYGAPGKGVTLLHYCGINADLIAYTVDRNPQKQHHFMPGTSIPIYPPEYIERDRPDYLFLLPWNLRNEIVKQQQGIRAWGGKFVVPIPQVEII
ncbi:MAG: class I SAM-dependent methyltransferase [Planctomycetota bacterium]|nr:class I SAM-dependent methyltransferase [Planctomycetota bacterium]